METLTTKKEMVAMAQTVKNSICEMIEKQTAETETTFFVSMQNQSCKDRETVSLSFSTMVEGTFSIDQRFSCDLYSFIDPSENMAKLVDFFARVTVALTPKPKPETQLIATPHVVEIVDDGVRVCVCDEDFVIALHDAAGDFLWQDASDKFVDKLPTVKQAHIIGAYLDEIQTKLEEAGGDRLDDWYWTRDAKTDGADYWSFYGAHGNVSIMYVTELCGVRCVTSNK